jgi:hypothetical protein
MIERKKSARSMVWSAGEKNDRNRDVVPENAEFLTEQANFSSDTYNLSRIAGLIIEDAAENHRLAKVERRLDDDLKREGADPSLLEPHRESRLKGAHTHTDDDSEVELVFEGVWQAHHDNEDLWEVNLSLPDRLCMLMRDAAPGPRSQSVWFNHAVKLYRDSDYQCRFERVDTKRQLLDYITEGEVVGETTAVFDAIQSPDIDSKQWVVRAHNQIFVDDGVATEDETAEDLEVSAELGEDINPDTLEVIKGESVDQAMIVHSALPDTVTSKEGVRSFIQANTSFKYNAANQLANDIMNRFDLLDVDEDTEEGQQVVQKLRAELKKKTPGKTVRAKIIEDATDISVDEFEGHYTNHMESLSASELRDAIEIAEEKL